MKERDLQNQIVKLLKDRGYWYLNPQGGSRGVKAGTPDLMTVVNGYFLGLELKLPKGKYKPTYLQKTTLNQITQQGGIGAIVTTLDFAEKIFKAAEREDDQWFKSQGYGQHNEEEILDDKWFEECIW